MLPLFIPEGNGSKLYLEDPSENPGGTELVSHGRHKNTPLLGSPCFTLCSAGLRHRIPTPDVQPIHKLLSQMLHPGKSA